MFKLFQLHSLLVMFFPFCWVYAQEIEQMSLEEKVGQVFMAYFEGEEVNEAAKKLIIDAKFGGIIYYNWANGLTDPIKIQKLSAQLQKLAKQHQGIPLLIATDQEGGLVARLQNGFTEFPGNAALGISESPELVYKAAYVMGKELKAVGINMNLAPVVDVNSNPENPIIGIRSFHSDPRVVAALSEAAVKGYLKANVVPCLKHFPGHGNTSMDSHSDRPVVEKSLAQLRKVELYPFEKLSNIAPAIMTAHILFPAIDKENVATLSKTILTDILRKKMGYSGLLVTDSLTMKGATYGYCDTEEVFIRAFEAGNDLLLIGGKALDHKAESESSLEQILRLHAAFLKAVQEGRISQERLNSSVARILKVKKEAGLYEEKNTRAEDLQQILNTPSSQKLAKEIAYRSVRVKNGPFIEGIENKKILVVYPKPLQTVLEHSDMAHLGSQTDLFCLKNLEPSDEEEHLLQQKVKTVEGVVFCSYNAWKSPKQMTLLRNIAEQTPTVIVATRDPYDLDIYRSNYVCFATYSPTTCSLQVVAEYLKSQTNPIDISLEKAKEIASIIWKNECGHRVDQLTFWNVNEDFPSIGIGHFIWPSKNYRGPFSSGRFHEVIQFMKTKGAEVPKWLLESKYCPWETREEFYKNFESERMKELRLFLVESAPYQAMYMQQRLNRFFKEMILTTPTKKRPLLLENFFRVADQPKGPYILIDYINFKHEGTDPKERYENKGWGLLQVLENMDPQKARHHPEDAFIDAAKNVLQERIHNAPNRQLQEKWIPGWWSRLETYRREA